MCHIGKHCNKYIRNMEAQNQRQHQHFTSTTPQMERGRHTEGNSRGERRGDEESDIQTTMSHQHQSLSPHQS